MLKELLEKHNIMLAVAESLTGGQLSSKICEEEGISKHYLGTATADIYYKYFMNSILYDEYAKAGKEELITRVKEIKSYE